jgi:polar amino acid transport system substrate-binding protein
VSRSAIRVLVWPAVVVALAGCGGVSTTAIGATNTERTPITSPTATPTPTSTTTQRPCDDATESYPPDAGPTPTPGAMPEDTTMYAIQEEGVLRVGVDETTQGLAYRDPDSGEIKGMEVDLAYEIARRIFGDLPPEQILDLVPVTTDEKIAAVKTGDVDLTIDAVSMSCARWQDVAFSTEYLTTDQRFLVRSDSPLRNAEDLDGRTVCVTEGSSSAGLLVDHAPGAELLEVGPRTECLVALQQGEADAYFGHDTFLRGMLSQDDTLEIREIEVAPAGETTSHYGIAVAHGSEDLVRFVNRALEEMRADGTWDTLHNVLEEDLCLPGVRPPVPPSGSQCSDRLDLPDADPPVAAYLPEEP